MPLILSQESRRSTPAASCRASPEHVINLLIPWYFHVIRVLYFHVDRVPAVRVSLSGRVVVMTGDEDVGEALAFCRREHGVQSVDASPVGEEVALVVVGPWVVAEIVIMIHSLNEAEILRYG